MTTVHHASNWKIKIYPDDHAPPHFHVQTPDGESLVTIDGLQILGKGANPKSLKAALTWASKNTQLLSSVWQQQNERG